MRLEWDFPTKEVDLATYDSENPIRATQVRFVVNTKSLSASYALMREDIDELTEWCATVLGNRFDFDGNLIWRSYDEGIYLTNPQHLVLFMLRFKGAS